MSSSLSINNREHPSTIKNTCVVVCLDGNQKEYLDEASKENLMPNHDKIIKKGEYLIVRRAF